MSNFEDLDGKYNMILRKIDMLRARGVAENDLEMIRARTALRDFLEMKKKNASAIQKVVPRLTGIKTVTIKTNQLGEKVETLFNVQTKYVMLGVVIGIIALIYFYLKLPANN